MLEINSNSEEIIWGSIWKNLRPFQTGNQWMELPKYHWKFTSHHIQFVHWSLQDSSFALKNERGKRWKTIILLLFFNHCIDAHCSLMLLLRLWWKWKTWGKNFKGSAFSFQVACQCTRSLLLALHCLRCYCLYEPRLPNPPIAMFH